MQNKLSTRDRAILLDRFINTLVNDKYGPNDPRDLTFVRIWPGASVHRANPSHITNLPKTNPWPYPYTYTGDKAPDALEEHGLGGFCLYWNDPHSGTDGLILIDIDEPRWRSELPESLEIRSAGSGGYHRVYHTDGSVKHYCYHNPDALNMKTSKVNTRGKEDYTIVPGSLGKSGVYRLNNQHPIAEITRADVPEELQP